MTLFPKLSFAVLGKRDKIGTQKRDGYGYEVETYIEKEHVGANEGSNQDARMIFYLGYCFFIRCLLFFP